MPFGQTQQTNQNTNQNTNSNNATQALTGSQNQQTNQSNMVGGSNAQTATNTAQNNAQNSLQNTAQNSLQNAFGTTAQNTANTGASSNFGNTAASGQTAGTTAQNSVGTTAQNVDPWAASTPMLQQILSGAQSAAQSPLQYHGYVAGLSNPQQQAIGQAQNGGTTAQGQGVLSDFMSGQYGSAGNPYFQQMADSVTQGVMPGINATFGGHGMTGSSLHQENLSKGLASALSPYAYQNYNQNLDRMMGAATSAPSLDTSRINNLMSTGALAQGQSQAQLNNLAAGQNYNQNAPWQQLQNYSGIVNPIAALGHTATGVQTGATTGETAGTTAQQGATMAGGTTSNMGSATGQTANQQTGATSGQTSGQTTGQTTQQSTTDQQLQNFQNTLAQLFGQNSGFANTNTQGLSNMTGQTNSTQTTQPGLGNQIFGGAQMLASLFL